MPTLRSFLSLALPTLLVASSQAAAAQLANPVIAAKEARLVAVNGQQQDQLAIAVAIDGDRAVCGAPAHSEPGQNASGAAWVFARNAGVWSQEAKLIALDGLADDRFGNAVAIDGNTIVVGAFRDDHPGNLGNAGSVYVFERVGGVWLQQAKLIGSGAGPADYFGYSVALEGDTLAVGAPFDEAGGVGSTGVLYVFVRNGGVWTEAAVLAASDATAGDYLGAAVALSGNTIVAGASRDDDFASASGSAYVFVGSGSTWVQQAKLLASDGAASDYFGTSVDVSGDVAIVGAPYHDGVAGDSGEAYAYQRSGTTWTQEAVLVPDALTISAHTGWSVAIDGDFALLGVPNDPVPGSTGGGSGRLFRRSGSSWTEETKVVHDATLGHLGLGVAISADEMLLGAPNDAAGLLAGQGCAYVFRMQNAPEIYCKAKLNSKGCLPAIATVGTPSVSGSVPFVISASNEINNTLGLLMYGHGLENNAFQGGLLCMTSPIVRTAALSSGGNPPPEDCSGVFSMDFNAVVQSGTDPLLGVGTDVFAQWWSRDVSLGTTYPVSLSNAVHFAIQP